LKPVTEVGDYQDLVQRFLYILRAPDPVVMVLLVVSKVNLLHADVVDFISNWLFNRVSRDIDDWKKISSSFGLLLQPGVLKVSSVESGQFDTVKAARKHITTLCKSEDLPAVGMQVPKSWWGVIDATEATRANGTTCTPYSSIKKNVPAEFRGVTEDALGLLESQGEIFQSCGLCFLSPSFMIDILRPLFDHRIRTDESSNSGGGISAFAERGFLNIPLLENFWSNVPMGDGIDPESIVEILVDSGTLFPVDDGKQWILPARLPKEELPGPLALWRSKWNHRSNQARLCSVFSFADDFIPPGLLERLVAFCFTLGEPHSYWRGGVHIKAKGVAFRLALEKDKKLHMAAVARSVEAGDCWAVFSMGLLFVKHALGEFKGLKDSVECFHHCPGCLSRGDITQFSSSKDNIMEVAQQGACVNCGEVDPFRLLSGSNANEEMTRLLRYRFKMEAAKVRQRFDERWESISKNKRNKLLRVTQKAVKEFSSADCRQEEHMSTAEAILDRGKEVAPAMLRKLEQVVTEC